MQLFKKNHKIKTKSKQNDKDPHVLTWKDLQKYVVKNFFNGKNSVYSRLPVASKWWRNKNL